MWESNVAIGGRDPDTGFARPGYDNEGVQYGLDALNAGVITPDQFLDLNAGIGGFDDDGAALARAFGRRPYDLVERGPTRPGRVTGAQGGLLETPIILVNVFTDEMGDIHDRVRSFSLLDRLADDDGNWPETAFALVDRSAPRAPVSSTRSPAPRATSPPNPPWRSTSG